MTTRVQTKITTMLSAGALITALIVPAASAAPSKPVRVTIPARFANFHEPGSTGYVPKAARVTIPARLAGFHEPGSTGYVPVASATASASSGLDWVSALIGAGAALGIALASAGGMIALRKRRTFAHV